MKKILLFIMLIVLSVSSISLLSACGDKYEDYDDFKKNGTIKEHKDFYDWWAKNP